MMKKRFYLIAAAVVAIALAGGMLSSCKNNPKKNNTKVPQEAAVSLSYADVAGMYDTQDNQTRICLYADSTATWNVIGSLNVTEFCYVLRGNNIYVDALEVNDDTAPDFIYDPEKKTLDGGEGKLYILQEKF